MSKCLIIPSNDGGPLDKRYGDIIVPAIRNAGMEASRLDTLNGAMSTEDVEDEIRDSDVCMMDVSSENPTIWYQLGFAMACGKPTILLCSQDRWKQFPIDSWNQAVLLYSSEDSANLDQLKLKITAKLKSTESMELQDRSLLDDFSSGKNALTNESLNEHELVCLLCVAQSINSPRDYVFFQRVKQDMVQYGYAPIAITLAITALLRKNLLMMDEVGDDFGNVESIYFVTENGLNWLQLNQNRFALRELSFMQRIMMKFGKKTSPVETTNYAFTQS